MASEDWIIAATSSSDLPCREARREFNEKFDPSWVPRYTVLDSVEYVATQAVVMAGAEGVTEIPVIGRFLGNVGQPT